MATGGRWENLLHHHHRHGYAKQYPVAGFSVYVRYTGQKRELGARCGRFGHTATHSAIRSGLFWFFSLISVFSSGWSSLLEHPRRLTS